MPSVDAPLTLAFAGVLIFVVGWLLSRAAAVRALRGIRFERDSAAQRASNLENQVKELGLELGAAKSDQKHYENERDAARVDLETLRAELKQLNIDYAKLLAQSEERLKAADDKLRLLSNAEAMLTVEFESLADRIFNQKEKQFVDTNKESISTLLKPIESKISEFKTRVDRLYEEENRDRASLRAEIVYDLRVEGTNNDGERHRPDVIIRLPQKRAVVIDSKVPLLAYGRWHEAASDEERRQYLGEHIDAIRDHIKKLSAKSYQDLIGVNSLDLVLMFIPIESAYSLTLDHDPSLLRDAFSKKIMIVSPRTLALFSESLTEIGIRLAQAQTAYETSRRRLMRGTHGPIDGAQVIETSSFSDLLGVSIKERRADNAPSNHS